VKVVIDTNVFVSGALFLGPPHEVLAACEAGSIELVLSAEILAEYRRVGRELLRGQASDDYETLLTNLCESAAVVTAPEFSRPVCRDADDDKFLACAIAGDARIVVSGDKDLLAVSGYAGIAVLTPRQFAERYLRRQG
jgi:uncharacterized protein